MTSNSNVACCTRPFPSSRAGDAIHPVLQEVGLGDSETRVALKMRMGFVMRMIKFATTLDLTTGSFYVLFLFNQLWNRSSLTPFQQLLVTLMRLQLNSSRQFLAYCFWVHSSTISQTFMHVINIMYVKLKPLILWPERELLHETIPMDFRKYCSNCIVIIDCF